ncbi:hypothetical protein SDJN03_09721, partial [Cucurbita argyrosperma subsp. sororia]
MVLSGSRFGRRRWIGQRTWSNRFPFRISSPTNLSFHNPMPRFDRNSASHFLPFQAQALSADATREVQMDE